MHRTMRNCKGLTAAAALIGMSFLAPAGKAQLFHWSKEDMVDYTKGWTGERFPDGRPKVPDGWLERAKGLSQEEVIIPIPQNGGPANIASFSQFDGDFKVI